MEKIMKFQIKLWASLKFFGLILKFTFFFTIGSAEAFFKYENDTEIIIDNVWFIHPYGAYYR